MCRSPKTREPRAKRGEVLAQTTQRKSPKKLALFLTSLAFLAVRLIPVKSIEVASEEFRDFVDEAMDRRFGDAMQDE
jgi:hypothetical protein